MVATVNASTSAGVVITPDNSGVLAFQSSSATALTIDASQNVTLVGTLTTTGITNSGVATATRFNPTGSSVTGNGMYLPAANSLGFSTNGTNAVTIDSSGRVTKPLHPSFQATGSFTPGTGVVAINSVTYDIGSNFNTTTYRFTAPVAGKYYFWGSVSFYTGTAGQYVRHGQLAIQKNGGTVAMTDFTYWNNVGNNQHVSPSAQSLVSLAVSDYVELNVITWSASGTFTNYGCYFGGYLIG